MANPTSIFGSLSSTEANNGPAETDAIGTNADDWLRRFQAHMGAWRDQTAWGILTLTSVAGTNTVTATLAAAGDITFGPTALSAGMKFLLVPANTNTGATTLNITSPNGGSALGAKNVYTGGVACVGGELVASVPTIVEYDGTQFNIIGPAVSGKQSIWIPAVAMISRTTNGAAGGVVETTTNKVMLRTYDFDASTAEYCQVSISMPKSWNEGTVTAAFVWSHSSTATNFDVVWGIQGLALSNDDAADTAFGTAQTVTDTGGTTDDIYRSAETSAVTIGNTPAENDLVVFQIYRDASNGSDTLAVDARLHGVMLFYTALAGTDA